MRASPRAYLWALLAAIDGLGIVVLPEQSLATVLPGLLLSLVLPPLAIMDVGFGGVTVRAYERAALAFGLHVSLIICGGLLLHSLGLPLDRVRWVIMLVIETSLVCLIGWLTGGAGLDSSPRRVPHPTVRSVVLASLGIVIAAAAVLQARDGAERALSSNFSLLWILPGKSADVIRIGVRNLEPATTVYRVDVRVGESQLLASKELTLPSGNTWETDLQLPDGRAQDVPITATLVRADMPDTEYRRVQLWKAGP